MEIRIYSINIRVALIALMLLALASCKKDTADNASVNMPVVVAYLIPGHIVSVKVYHQKTLTDTAAYGTAFTGLQLQVSDGSTDVTLTETSKGTYTYSDVTFLVTGKTYTMKFTYNGKVISAQTTIPAAPQNFTQSDTAVNLGTVSGGVNGTADTVGYFKWSNPASLNHLLVFYNYDKTVFPVGSSRFGEETATSNFELSAAEASAYYLTQTSFTYYGEYRVILFTVNQEYINFIKTNTIATTSQNVTNAYTNINNGYGIFTAMQGDTLILGVNY